MLDFLRRMRFFGAAQDSYNESVIFFHRLPSFNLPEKRDDFLKDWGLLLNLRMGEDTHKHISLAKKEYKKVNLNKASFTFFICLANLDIALQTYFFIKHPGDKYEGMFFNLTLNMATIITEIAHCIGLNESQFIYFNQVIADVFPSIKLASQKITRTNQMLERFNLNG